MPYVERNEQGTIIALYQQSSDKSHEFLPASSQEVLAFVGIEQQEGMEPRQALAESDTDIARVTEDLIHLLIQKNMILFTELPEAVQRKLLAREKLRQSLQQPTDFLLDDGDTL